MDKIFFYCRMWMDVWCEARRGSFGNKKLKRARCFIGFIPSTMSRRIGRYGSLNHNVSFSRNHRWYDAGYRSGKFPLWNFCVAPRTYLSFNERNRRISLKTLLLFFFRMRQSAADAWDRRSTNFKQIFILFFSLFKKYINIIYYINFLKAKMLFQLKIAWEILGVPLDNWPCNHRIQFPSGTWFESSAQISWQREERIPLS